MKEILLLSPPSRAFNHYRPPLALMYLAGYLKKNGVKARIVDVVLRHQIRDSSFYRNVAQYLRNIEDETVARVAAADADVVGITCYTPELAEVEALAGRIKAVKPGVTIVVGGVHPTLYPEHFLSAGSPVSFVVIGEGEVTLLDLVRSIRCGASDFHSVQGIAYYDNGKGSSTVTERRPLVERLDDIAFPDCDDLDMDYYTSASPYAIRGVFTRSFYVSSSRGCPSSCTFCVSKKLREFHGITHYARLRSPGSLYEEIMALRGRYAIDSFYFIDDLFTLKKDNVREFCGLLRTGGSNLIWGCSSKVNTVDREILGVMRDAGCVQIDFGVEKGSDAALARVKKGITVEQVERTFSDCRELGIRTFANMLMNTPGETEQDLSDMIDLLGKIKPTIVSANIFTPYPGCEIFDEAAGRITRDDYPLLMQDPARLVKEQPAKFKFAAHSVDPRAWVNSVMKRFNRFGTNIRMFFDRRYINSFMGSRRKFNYLCQSWSLLREYMNQKV